jgi:hypothetical protein
VVCASTFDVLTAAACLMRLLCVMSVAAVLVAGQVQGAAGPLIRHEAAVGCRCFVLGSFRHVSGLTEVKA